jgi:uncharacterized phage protein (TIGR01671 family)
MREIKFRAWSKEFGMSPATKLLNMLQVVAKKESHDYPDEYLTLMQYTGLEDKNGKEIYEGDIIRKVPEDWPSKSESDPRTLEQYLHDMSRVYVVEYQRDRFLLALPHTSYQDRISGGQHGSIEVIGNIYENPELLEAAA